jgi:hypothetical protein
MCGTGDMFAWSTSSAIKLDSKNVFVLHGIFLCYVEYILLAKPDCGISFE